MELGESISRLIDNSIRFSIRNSVNRLLNNSVTISDHNFIYYSVCKSVRDSVNNKNNLI